MFITQPAAQRFPLGPYDDTIQCWGVVERDLETPWFHLCLELQEGGFAFGHTLLVADVAQLDSVLGQLTADSSVRSLMLVTPPSMNHSPHWRMERVVRLQVSLDKSAGILFRVDMDGGKRYSLLSLNQRWEPKDKARCIYDASLAG
ncbi:hypothetical protein IB252_10690 [Pseudomonas sp. PDM10]|uniref:hypothetical protein n=1 Tax=Pseudomonas sp. PDM10 TaxID=2769269 RepID=UPI00177AA037|nr:hypothetical protein [Pseudomonas sp. PDM10]MBD9600269.1 hypothetical protein [Pseudomonas sp. PDM10]